MHIPTGAVLLGLIATATAAPLGPPADCNEDDPWDCDAFPVSGGWFKRQQIDPALKDIEDTLPNIFPLPPKCHGLKDLTQREMEECLDAIATSHGVEPTDILKRSLDPATIAQLEQLPGCDNYEQLTKDEQTDCLVLLLQTTMPIPSFPLSSLGLSPLNAAENDENVEDDVETVYKRLVDPPGETSDDTVGPNIMFLELPPECHWMRNLTTREMQVCISGIMRVNHVSWHDIFPHGFKRDVEPGSADDKIVGQIQKIICFDYFKSLTEEQRAECKEVFPDSPKFVESGSSVKDNIDPTSADSEIETASKLDTEFPSPSWVSFVGKCLGDVDQLTEDELAKCEDFFPDEERFDEDDASEQNKSDSASTNSNISSFEDYQPSVHHVGKRSQPTKTHPTKVERENPHKEHAEVITQSEGEAWKEYKENEDQPLDRKNRTLNAKNETVPASWNDGTPDELAVIAAFKMGNIDVLKKWILQAHTDLALRDQLLHAYRADLWPVNKPLPKGFPETVWKRSVSAEAYFNKLVGHINGTQPTKAAEDGESDAVTHSKPSKTAAELPSTSRLDTLPVDTPSTPWPILPYDGQSLPPHGVPIHAKRTSSCDADVMDCEGKVDCMEAQKVVSVKVLKKIAEQHPIIREYAKNSTDFDPLQLVKHRNLWWDEEVAYQQCTGSSSSKSAVPIGFVDVLTSHVKEGESWLLTTFRERPELAKPMVPYMWEFAKLQKLADVPLYEPQADPPQRKRAGSTCEERIVQFKAEAGNNKQVIEKVAKDVKMEAILFTLSQRQEVDAFLKELKADNAHDAPCESHTNYILLKGYATIQILEETQKDYPKYDEELELLKSQAEELMKILRPDGPAKQDPPSEEFEVIKELEDEFKAYGHAKRSGTPSDDRSELEIKLSKTQPEHLYNKQNMPTAKLEPTEFGKRYIPYVPDVPVPWVNFTALYHTMTQTEFNAKATETSKTSQSETTPAASTPTFKDPFPIITMRSDDRTEPKIELSKTQPESLYNREGGHTSESETSETDKRDEPDVPCVECDEPDVPCVDWCWPWMSFDFTGSKETQSDMPKAAEDKTIDNASQNTTMPDAETMKKLIPFIQSLAVAKTVVGEMEDHAETEAWKKFDKSRDEFLAEVEEEGWSDFLDAAEEDEETYEKTGHGSKDHKMPHSKAYMKFQEAWAHYLEAERDVLLAETEDY